MIIGLMTDFGTGENYAGIMKGVILGINPDAEIVDITHGIQPYSIVNAQYMLFSAYRYFPRQTIFCVVVDPGVGSGRNAIIVQEDDYSFILPDNGIISAVLPDQADCYTIDTDRYGHISSTFHGRDVFAPAAAELSLGTGLSVMGSHADSIIHKPFPEYTTGKSYVQGQVIHVDAFGNVVTSIPDNCLKRVGIGIIGIHDKTIPVKQCSTFSDLTKDEVGLYAGSSGFMEVALNRESFADHFDVKLEDNIRLMYYERP